MVLEGLGEQKRKIVAKIEKLQCEIRQLRDQIRKLSETNYNTSGLIAKLKYLISQQAALMQSLKILDDKTKDSAQADPNGIEAF